METNKNQGQIIIHLEGNYSGKSLTPDNYDITLMQNVLKYAISMLDLDKRKDGPITTLHLEEGSVKNIFTTSKQKVVEFASVISLILSSSSIDYLDAKTAVAFEEIQNFASQNNFNVNISSSESTKDIIKITPTSYFRRTENLWADAEVYYYGTIIDAGGKNKSNIHLDTSDGLIKIDASKELLTNLESNPLYRKFGVRAMAKQNIITGSIDRSSLRLIEILDFEPKFDLSYLEKKMEASTPIWSGIDADEFLHEIREGKYVGQ
jgi:hypothetical protein